MILSGITINYSNCYSTVSNNSNYYNLTNKEYKIINKACSDTGSKEQDESNEIIIPNTTDSDQKELENALIQCLTEDQYLLSEIWENIINLIEECDDVNMICQYQKKNTCYNFSQLLKYTESMLSLYQKILNPIIFNRFVLNKKIPLSKEDNDIVNKINNQDIVNIFKKYEEQYKLKCNILLKIINESLDFLDKMIEAVNSKRISTIKRSPVFITDLLNIRKNLNNVKNLYYYSMYLNFYKDFINKSIEKISELKSKMFLNAI